MWSAAARADVVWTLASGCEQVDTDDLNVSSSYDFRVEVSGGAASWQAEILVKLVDEVISTRHFVGASCEAVVSAAKMHIRLHDAANNEVVDVAETSKDKTPVSEAPLELESMGSDVGHWFVRATSGVDLTSAPKPTPTVAVAVGKAWRSVALEIGFLYAAPRAADSGLGKVGLLAAQTFVCRQNLFGFAVCGGAEWGSQRGVGLGLRNIRSASGPWFALLLGVRKEWDLGKRWGFVIGGETGISIVAPTFVVNHTGGAVDPTAENLDYVVHEPKTWVARLRAGFLFHF